MATATDYLPEAVGGYLRLPRQFADNRPVDRGKSSLMILIDQLDLLASTMDKVFDAVCRDDAAALVAHGRSWRRSSAPPRAAAPWTSARPDAGSSRPPVGTPDGHPAPAERTPRACRPTSPCPRRWRGRHGAGRRRPGSTRGPPETRHSPWRPPWPSRLPGPPLTGAAAVGEGGTQDFFDAASRGRRWRGSPTAILSSPGCPGLAAGAGVREAPRPGRLGRLPAGRADHARHRQRVRRRRGPARGRRRPPRPPGTDHTPRPAPQPSPVATPAPLSASLQHRSRQPPSSRSSPSGASRTCSRSSTP